MLRASDYFSKTSTIYPNQRSISKCLESYFLRFPYRPRASQLGKTTELENEEEYEVEKILDYRGEGPQTKYH
jgi:hypothetical protein